jgi:lipopolysaccharide transport system permease protein
VPHRYYGARTSVIEVFGSLRLLFDYRGLIYNLAIRDLRLKYKRSTIGVAWSLLNPLLMMLIYTIIFSVFLRTVVTPGRPYWALVLAGLLAWLFFSNSVGSAPVTFVHSGNLVARVSFPIESLPIASVLANFVNFLISLAILLVVLAAIRLPLGPSLVLLPVILLAQLAFTIGASLLVATLTVYLRDLEHLIGVGLTALFYLTPVLYPLDPASLPRGADRIIPYLKLNPLAWFLDSYHAVLFYGVWPSLAQFLLMLGAAALALVVGYLVFLRLRTRLPEEV